MFPHVGAYNVRTYFVLELSSFRSYPGRSVVLKLWGATSRGELERLEMGVAVYFPTDKN
jgi:hypothetical protein